MTATAAAKLPTEAWPLSSIVRWAERHGWGVLEGRRYQSTRRLLQHHADIGRRARGADLTARFTGTLWQWAEQIGWRTRKTASRAVYGARELGLVFGYTPGTIAYGEPTRTVITWHKAALVTLLMAGRDATAERRAQARMDYRSRLRGLATDRVLYQRLKAAPAPISAGPSMGTLGPPSIPKGEDSPRMSPLTAYAEPSTPAPAGVVDQARAAVRAVRASRAHRGHPW